MHLDWLSLSGGIQQNFKEMLQSQILQKGQIFQFAMRIPLIQMKTWELGVVKWTCLLILSVKQLLVHVHCTCGNSCAENKAIDHAIYYTFQWLKCIF